MNSSEERRAAALESAVKFHRDNGLADERVITTTARKFESFIYNGTISA